MTVENLFSCPNVLNCYIFYKAEELDKRKKNSRIIPLNLTQANDRAPQTHHQKREKASDSTPLQYHCCQHH
jgi:hypothetical protein